MAGGNAGLFGGIGPNAYVNNLYAPQQQQLATQQAARTGTLQQLVQSILSNLSQPRPDVYGAAAQDATSAANGAANTLQSLNPNDTTQAMLRAIGAPQSQQSQVAGQNANTFTGGAALNQYLGGALPAGVFAQDAAARNTYLNSLPAIVGQSAIQGLGRLQMLASQENSTLASNKAKALQQAQADLAKFVQTNQKTKFSQNLAVAKYQTGVGEFNARQALDYKKFAQQTVQQNRMYGLSLARLGIANKSLQLRIAQNAYKMANGGFSQSEIKRYNQKLDSLQASGSPTRPVNGAIPAPIPMDANGKPIKINPTTGLPTSKPASWSNNNTYSNFIRAALQKGVPLQLALNRANTIWPPTQRGNLGALAQLPALAAQAKAQSNAYNQMTGVGTNGKTVLGTSPTGQQVTLQSTGSLSKATKGILAGAVEYLGTPYAWGGESPTGFDCSGLAQYLYGKVGVNIPRTTYDQFKGGLAVPKGQLQPGDLVFFKGSDSMNGLPGHVGIYVGGGKMIDAPHTGSVVRVESVGSFGGYMGARRYVH